MKPDQTRYAKERIQKVLSEYENAQQEKYMTDKKELNPREKLRLIREQEVKLLWPTTRLTTTMLLIEAFDFTSIEREEQLDHKKFTAAMTPVRREAAAVIDQIMLGDSEQAVALVTSFVKKYGAG